MMNGYGPPPAAPPAYPYPAPPQQNGFYPPAAGNMGYPCPTAAAGADSTISNFLDSPEGTHEKWSVVLLGWPNCKYIFFK